MFKTIKIKEEDYQYIIEKAKQENRKICGVINELIKQDKKFHGEKREK